MARTARSTQLETRAARLRLAPRKKPYRAASAKQGLHLGYRRMANKNGSWIAFAYQGQSDKKAGRYSERAFAQADDYSEADGHEVLNYFDAIGRVSDAAPPIRRSRGYTVQDAIGDYVTWLGQHRKTADDAKARLAAYVTPFFGDRQLERLKPADFDNWLSWALPHRPRGRLKDGKQTATAEHARAVARGRKAKPLPPEVPAAEKARRRRSTLNRVINYLLGALNRAYEQGHVDGRTAWARVRKFKNADSARIARLSTEEAKRLLNACAPDFRQLVEVALLTGCRYGELTAFAARDFDADQGTLLVAESKSGKPRRVPLTDEGQQLLESLTADKAPDELVLVKTDGTAWNKSEQFRRMRAACEAANIVPPVNFHAIRHTFASLLIEAGTPLAFVAEALGHSDTRMVSKHYAHLAPSIVHAEIRKNLPTFGVHVETTVRKLKP
jgi:integrase